MKTFEEGKNAMKTFEEGKNAKELGIDLTRKFVVIEEGGNFKKGDILTVERDNDSDSPYFINKNGNREWTYWYRLAYAEKNWDNLEEGDVLIDSAGDETCVLGICGEVIFRSARNEFDKYWGGYTKKQLQKIGWNIKDAVEETEELTMDEVCKELGRTIKIKK